MTDQSYTDEDVESAARALFETERVATDVESWDTLGERDRDSYRKVIRAVLDDLASRRRLVIPPGQRAGDWHVGPCGYVSTACTHARRDEIPDLHGRCRLSCKWCGQVCGCRDCEHLTPGGSQA